MALPILETATYELTLPSTDVKIKYRPFLVKEEKILLMALESGENKQITSALKEIVSTCTFNAINVNLLPTFDLEYVFLQIRAKSVGEVVKVKLLCPDDKKTYGEVEVDLTKVEVHVDDKHDNKIQINDKVSILMKYPTIDAIDPNVDTTKLKTENLFQIIANSIHEIYEGDKVHNVKDYTKEDIQKFIDGLNTSHFNKIQGFFNTMPKLQHDVEVVNPKTKVKSKMTLSGLSDFFQSPSHTTT
jgi:hypothetical protein|tara:strand:+ start:4707 stop:5438 length:732 start_codon:yes stop_codon:yes gene_type:complete